MVRELAITPDVLRLVEDDTGANPAVVNPLREMVFRRCVADFEFFVSTFWQVPVVGKGYRQWDLYDYQRSEARVLQELQRLGLQGESTREIRLKARQVGFTTEATAFTFWSAFFHPDLPWLISSRTEDDAQLALAEKVVAPMQRLPQWLLARGPKVSTQNADELSFDNGSGITSIPASSGAGRSRAVFGVLVDEYAFVEDQDSLFAALDPLCYGMMIVFSTANGMGNNFHSLWVDAAASDSIWNATSKRLRTDERWHGAFVPWHAVPGRDEKWYEARKRSYRAKPWVFYQEFPACIAGDQRVGTDLGLLPISEVAEASRVAAGPVTGFWPKSEAPIFRLLTEDGYSLRATADHPVLTVDGDWVPVGDAEGREVVLGRPLLAEREHVERLPHMGHELHVPITEEFGEWLGFFMGDGSYSGQTISFACDANDRDVIDRIAYLHESIWGFPLIERQVSAGGVELRASRSELSPIMDGLGLTREVAGGRRTRKVCVPDVIWRSPAPVVRAFLRGLFESDGFQGKDRPRVSLFSKHESFLRDVQQLLLALGVVSTYSESQTRNGQGYEYISRTLEVLGHRAIAFNERIGFVGGRKQGRYPAGHEYSGMGRPPKSNDLASRVVSVVPDGFEPVWDLTVADEHRFDAGGIVVHNSPEEAFSRSGRMAWPDELVSAQPWAVPEARYDFSLFDLGREPRTLVGAERLMPQQEADLELWVWEPPTIERDRTGRVVRPPNYVIGVDTSEGLDHGDRTSIVVGNANTGEIVATLLGAPFLEDIGRMVEWLGYLYHTALIVIERNNTGLVPNEFLAQANYPRLYRLNPHETGRPRYGFHTTSASKPALVAAMGKALRDDAVVLHDERFLLEARMFVADGRGGFSAIKGRHDDHVMGHLLCLHGMEFAGSYPVTFVDRHGPPTLGDIFGYAHERSLGVGESPLDVPIRPKSPIG